MSACNMLHPDRAPCLLSAHSIHAAMGVVGGGGRGIIFCVRNKYHSSVVVGGWGWICMANRKLNAMGQWVVS